MAALKSLLSQLPATIVDVILGRCCDFILLFTHPLQLIEDKKTLSEKCEAVVTELKQVDQKYTKKIAQMQEQHELVRK